VYVDSKVLFLDWGSKDFWRNDKRKNPYSLLQKPQNAVSDIGFYGMLIKKTTPLFGLIINNNNLCAQI
jgi:hypothetical protein